MAQEVEIPSSLRTQSIQISPDGDKVFILNDNSTVSVFDVSSQQFVVSNKQVFLPFLSGRIPTEIKISHGGRDFLVGGSDPELYHFAIYAIADFLKNDDLFKVPVVLSSIPRARDDGTMFSAFSEDESSVYFIDALSHELSVFTIKTEKIETFPVNIAEKLVNFSIDNQNKFGFVLTLDPGHLMVIDLTSGKIVGDYKVGDKPQEIKYSEAKNSVYVTNRSSDTVAIVDLKSKTVQSVVAGTFPVRLAYDAIHDQVFVASNGDGTLFEISKNGSKPIVKLGTPGYGSYPIDVWYSKETGRIVAVNPYHGTVYIVEPKTGEILLEKKIEGWPTKVIGGEEGSVAAILRQNSNDLTLIDTQTLSLKNVASEEVPAEKVFSAPLNIQYDYQTSRLFVGNVGTGDISVVDSATLELIKKIPIGFQPRTMFLSEKHHKLFISNTSGGFITVVDLSNDDYVTHVVQTGDMPQVVQGLEGLDKAYVALSIKNTVGVINMTTNELVTKIPLGIENKFPFSLTRSEERKEVYVTNYGADSVSVIDAKTDTVLKTITVGKKPLWLSYHPATQLVFVTIEGEKEVVVIDPNKLAVTKRLKTTGIPYRVFSDDATGIVYVTHRGDKYVEIFTADKTEGLMRLDVREMNYLGEFGTGGYNMMTMDTPRFNKETKHLYITSTANDRVVATDVSRDSQGILNITAVKAILENGEVFDTPGISPAVSGGSSRTIVAGLFLVAGGVLFVLWRIRRGVVIAQKTQSPSSTNTDHIA